MDYITNPDTRFLRLGPDDYFTLEDATRSVACFGATGSGKTTGSGKALASAYLRAGMGGIVLCAKPDEITLWQHYAEQNGREKDLVLFGEGGSHTFNFIDYELKAQGIKGLGSVTECIMRILEAERVVNPNLSGKSEPFWERSPRQLLNNTLPLLYAAWGTVRMEDIYRFLASAPKAPTDLEDGDWQARSFMFETWAKSADEPHATLEAEEARRIMEFWAGEFAHLDAKTRGNIVMNLTTAIDRFLRGRLRDHFSRETTITPEETFREGRIIVLAMPSLSWNEDGLIGQHVFKYLWQRAVLRRNAMPEACRRRPVFLWADEAQYFVSVKDAEYQAACRSSLGCSVYLTQSMPSLLASLGDGGKALTDQLLGNFATKIFHSNADPETNDWASRTIGKRLTVRRNFSEGRTNSTGRAVNDGTGTGSQVMFGNGGNFFGLPTSKGETNQTGTSVNSGSGTSQNQGGSEVMDFSIEPRSFAQELRTGGRSNDRKVDAVWFQTGRRFKETGDAHLRVTFDQ